VRTTILIVDDDPGILHVLARGLSQTLGLFHVITAADGLEAIEVLERGHVDVVVTDLAMPIRDGFAILSYLINRRLTTPVIILTGVADEQLAQRLSGYQGLTVLRKPASYQEVAAAAVAALEDAKLGELMGIPLPAVLQLVELERRTCTIVISSRRRYGQLHVIGGRIADAHVEASAEDGHDAVLEILSWDEPVIEFQSLHEGITSRIDTPIQHLLIDAVRRHDAPAPTRAAVPVGPPNGASGAGAPGAGVSGAGVSGAGVSALSVSAVSSPRTTSFADFEVPWVPPSARAPVTAGAHAASVEAHVTSVEAEAAAVRSERAAVRAGEASTDGATAATDAPAEPAPGAAPDTPLATGGDATFDAASVLAASMARLGRRIAEADAALAAVEAEAALLLETRRELERRHHERRARRAEVERWRGEVARLAADIVDRVDAIFAAEAADHSAEGANGG
jgi:CheY-like chemotaxis protein